MRRQPLDSMGTNSRPQGNERVARRPGHRARVLAAVMLGATLAAGPEFRPQAAAAQAPLTLRVEGVDARDRQRVAVDLALLGGDGVPLADLSADAFTVREDGRAEELPIQALDAASDAQRPLSLVLALDLSGSMAGQALEDAKAAGRAVLAQLGPADRVALVAFADAIALDATDPGRESPFTADKAAVAALMEGLQAGGNTPLYDAAYKAVTLAAAETGGTRAVLLLTDGRDEVRGGARGSGSAVANEDSPVREANRAGVPVFTIGLGDGQDEAWLRRVALETGGTYQTAPSSAELTDRFGAVLARLKLRYRLIYASAATDAGRHLLTIRARQGDATAEDVVSFVAGGVGVTPEAATDGKAGAATEAVEAGPTAAAGTDAAVPAGATGEAGAEDGSATPLRWRYADWLLGLAGVLAILIAAVARRKRRPPVVRCLNCGRQLAGTGEPCPNCGFGGTYES